MKKLVAILFLMVLVFCVGWFVGEKEGADSGARQMVRHLLNPAFETDGFDAVVRDEMSRLSYSPTEDREPNEPIDWEQAAKSWQYAAEHYGGICKWLLEGEPIYGTIVMDSNTVLRDCLIVSGSSDGSIVIEGENGLIANNHFMALDMDWVLSTTAVDPNEVEDYPQGFSDGFRSAVDRTSYYKTAESDEPNEVVVNCPFCGKDLSPSLEVLREIIDMAYGAGYKNGREVQELLEIAKSNDPNTDLAISNLFENKNAILHIEEKHRKWKDKDGW